MRAWGSCGRSGSSRTCSASIFRLSYWDFFTVLLCTRENRGCFEKTIGIVRRAARQFCPRYKTNKYNLSCLDNSSVSLPSYDQQPLERWSDIQARAVYFCVICQVIPYWKAYSVAPALFQLFHPPQNLEKCSADGPVGTV